MKAVIIACPDIKLELKINIEYLLVKNSSRLTSARARSFATVNRGGVTLTAGRCAMYFFLPRPTSDRRASLDCRVGWGSPR